MTVHSSVCWLHTAILLLVMQCEFGFFCPSRLSSYPSSSSSSFFCFLLILYSYVLLQFVSSSCGPYYNIPIFIFIQTNYSENILLATIGAQCCSGAACLDFVAYVYFLLISFYFVVAAWNITHTYYTYTHPAYFSLVVCFFFCFFAQCLLSIRPATVSRFILEWCALCLLLLLLPMLLLLASLL